MEDTNITVQTGNLTRDPELRRSPGGTAICDIRLAVNGRRKDGRSGEWVDKPNFFNVTCFGAVAESAAEYLEKGRRILVEGRLDWSEWEAKDGSGKRQAVQIIAGRVRYLGGKPGERSDSDEAIEPQEEPAGIGATGADEDIPF
ncbi:MAG: single-stranded DNA-binding protein [Solirubrobacterales bacterium]